MKRSWILTLVGLLMSISSFQSVKAQLNLIPQGFDSSGTHPQAFRFIIEGHSSFDSTAIVDNQSRPSYPRMVDTGWVINDATVTSVIGACQRGHGHRQIWGNCTIPDSITWVIDSWTTEVCTTAYYVNVPHLSVQLVFSHRTSRWPTQCWLQKPKGAYARTKPGKLDLTAQVPRVNHCGDTVITTVIYDEDLWEQVTTPSLFRDTIDYRVYPNGTQEWTYGAVPRMVGEIDTVLIMVEGYSGNAMTFRREYAFIINWMLKTYREVSLAPSIVQGGIYKPLKGDFNNDNRGDIALWEAATGDLFIALGNGFNTFSPLAGPGRQGSLFANGWKPGVGPYEPFIADFSGDGYDDLALLDLSNGAWYVAFNWIVPGLPFFQQANSPNPNNAWITGGWGEYPYYAVVDDFSQDGFADVCVFHPTLGSLSMLYNWGNCLKPALGTALGGSWISGWNAASRGTYIPFSGDVSGDGYPDVFALQTSSGRWNGVYNYAIPAPPRFIVAPGKYANNSWIASGWGEAPYISFFEEYTGDNMKEVSCWHPTLGAIFVTQKLSNEFKAKLGPYSGGAMLSGWKAGQGFTPLSTDFSGDNYADYVLYDPITGSWYMAFNWGTEFRIVNGTASNGACLSQWGIKSTGSAKLADTVNSEETLPRTPVLAQNYPNPFNPTTIIQYSLPEAAEVQLVIYNVLGERVITLVNQGLPAGTYQVDWDGANTVGTQCASGVYFYRLSTDSFTESKKMILLK